MNYTELTHEDIMGGLTKDAQVLFSPIMDEVEYYYNHTEEIDVLWDEIEITHDEELLINGYTVHPYLQWRLTNYILNASKRSIDFWLDNPDIWVEVLKKGLKKFRHKGTILVTNNQLISLNDLNAPLETHMDMIEPLFDSAQKLIKSTGLMCALTGFQVDPIRVFLRVILIGGPARRFPVGLQIDSNYLFKKGFTRASMSHYVRDLSNKIDMSFYPWWNIHTSPFTTTATNYSRSLDKAIRRSKTQGFKTQYDKTVRAVLKLADSYPEQVWRQSTFLRVQATGLSPKVMRRTLANTEYRNKLDYCMALISTDKGFSLDRQEYIERRVASYLKGIR